MFINSILVTLIERSVDLRVIRFLVRVISYWIKYKSGGPLMNQMPSLKEKLVLLQRLSVCMEKRFSALETSDLHKTFLETIAYVYSNDMYSNNLEFKVISGLNLTLTSHMAFNSFIFTHILTHNINDNNQSNYVKNDA